MNYREIITIAYCGNGPEKLEKAGKLFSEFGRSLLAREEIVVALKALRTAVVLLDEQMKDMDMGTSCSACAAQPNGGCCSAYMGHENNDVLQLLMNMLAGVEVKLLRDDDIECCFLAETGCILLFKPVFCLNYLCGRIRDVSDPTDLAKLEEKTGRLLGLQVECEQLLIKSLQE